MPSARERASLPPPLKEGDPGKEIRGNFTPFSISPDPPGKTSEKNSQISREKSAAERMAQPSEFPFFALNRGHLKIRRRAREKNIPGEKRRKTKTGEKRFYLPPFGAAGEEEF